MEVKGEKIPKDSPVNQKVEPTQFADSSQPLAPLPTQEQVGSGWTTNDPKDFAHLGMQNDPAAFAHLGGMPYVAAGLAEEPTTQTSSSENALSLKEGADTGSTKYSVSSDARLQEPNKTNNSEKPESLSDKNSIARGDDDGEWVIPNYTESDIREIQRRVWQVIDGGRRKGWHVAASNLEHWITGGATPRIEFTREFLEKQPAFQRAETFVFENYWQDKSFKSG